MNYVSIALHLFMTWVSINENEFVHNQRTRYAQGRACCIWITILTLILLQVQPVAELSELSRRGSCDGRQVELAFTNIRDGTLRRSGSLRFHQNTVSFIVILNTDISNLNIIRLYIILKENEKCKRLFITDQSDLFMIN